MAVNNSEYKDSILQSVKLQCGIEPEMEHFDPIIITHINSVFRTLFQLGVGPQDHPYRIESGEEKWTEFIEDNSMDDARTYVGLRVKLLFDPPTNSFLVKAIEDQIKETEWRLEVGN